MDIAHGNSYEAVSALLPVVISPSLPRTQKVSPGMRVRDSANIHYQDHDMHKDPQLGASFVDS